MHCGQCWIIAEALRVAVMGPLEEMCQVKEPRSDSAASLTVTLTSGPRVCVAQGHAMS